jgi:type IV pilus assembly protein PilC
VEFDELYRNLVRAGESSGVLETVLETIANYKENIESIKGKIKKALFYPATVIAVAIIVCAILLIFVVPTFKETFVSFGADLPAFTALVFGISEVVVAWWWLIAISAAVAIGAFLFVYKRSVPLQHLVDRMMLKIPVIGNVLNNSAIARFARTLAVTFKAGVPLVEALESVAGAAGNAVYAEATQKIQRDVSTGSALTTSMQGTGVFPNMVIQMASIGEESGSLDHMLAKAAEFYEEEVDDMVKGLSSLMEPIIIVVLGTIIGGIVVAMYLPIFKIGQVV